MNRKQHKTNQNDESTVIIPLLEKLRSEGKGFNVPDGYFDTLGSRIADEIQNWENKTFLKSLFHSFRKPLVWAPFSVSVIAVLIFIFLVPANNKSVSPATDELSELILAYDASYAEEVLLAESQIIDNELENIEINSIGSATYAVANEPTEKEISEYLKDQEIDLEIINGY